MQYKTICCITSKSYFGQAEKVCADINRHLNVPVDLAETDDFQIQNYDVILYIHSAEATSDRMVIKLLKQASDLNKTFLPVIIGGSFFSNLKLKLNYKGPNLRTSFLLLRKRRNLFEFYNRIAAYAGVKLVGDPLGAKYNFKTDYDCKLNRSGETIAELKANQQTTINLYYGTHKLIALAKVDNKIKKEFTIKVDSIDSSLDYSLTIGKLVTFVSDFDCFVYQNTRLVGSLTANKGSNISLLEGKSKIRFQIESSRLKNKFDYAISWDGRETRIDVKLKKRVVGKTEGFGISRSDYASYRQMTIQKEALQKKMWSLPAKEQRKIQNEIDKLDTKLEKLKQHVNKETKK